MGQFKDHFVFINNLTMKYEKIINKFGNIGHDTKTQISLKIQNTL